MLTIGSGLLLFPMELNELKAIFLMEIFYGFFLQSGSEKTSTRSRLGSSSSITSEQSPVADSSENGGEAIDYKALYEAARYV